MLDDLDDLVSAQNQQTPSSFFPLLNNSVDPELPTTEDFLDLARLELGSSYTLKHLQEWLEWGKAYGLRPARALLVGKVLSVGQLQRILDRSQQTTVFRADSVDWQVVGLLDESWCRRAGVIPFRRDSDGVVVVACSSDLTDTTRDYLQIQLGGYRIERISKSDIDTAWRVKPQQVEGLLETAQTSEVSAAQKNWQTLTSQSGESVDRSAGYELSKIFTLAAQQEVSDVHIESREQRVDVRFRRQGVLQEFLKLTKNLGVHVINRLRVNAAVPKDDPNGLADARMDIAIPGNSSIHHVRLSFFPTHHGPSVVMRILSAQAGSKQLEEVWEPQYSPPNRLPMAQRLKDLLSARSDGVVLVAGATGSGKTTTLAAMLKELVGNGGTKILSAEQPVEYGIEGVQQVEVVDWHGEGAAPRGHRSWGNVLRAFLRADPDVIMIGEIRDEETARIAIRAAQTGHIVLASIHVTNVANAPARLIDMAPNSEPLLAESLNGVLSQKLIKTVCKSCGGGTNANECRVCDGSGLLGRAPVGELLVVNDGIRDAISQQYSPAHLVRQAMPDQSQIVDTLGHMVACNYTTLDEVMRVYKTEIGNQVATWRPDDHSANEIVESAAIK